MFGSPHYGQNEQQQNSECKNERMNKCTNEWKRMNMDNKENKTKQATAK